jgi:hypothetical protein
MPSQRATIKDAVIAAIKSASSVAGNRVYKGRHNVTSGTNFPLVYVWMQRDDADTNTMSYPRESLHTMTLAVDYWAKAATPDALEDAFDSAVDAIRDGILDAFVNVARQDLLLTSTEFLYEGDEAEPFGCARSTYTVKYFTTEP